jgi:hypothetical protein
LAATKTLADRERLSASEWLRRLLYAKFKEGGVLETLDAEGTPAPPGRPSLKSLWRQTISSTDAEEVRP